MKGIIKLFKTILILIFILCLIGAITVCYAFFIEPNQLKTEEVNISSKKLKEPVSIAVFADTHFGAGYKLENFDKVIAKINEKEVDYVIFTGDLIDNYQNYKKNTSIISSKLLNIKAKKGKYAVFGNHDYGGGAQNYYKSIMNKGGFEVLINQSVSFNQNNLKLIGVDDFLIGYGNSSIVNKENSNTYNLVICHEPDVFDNFNKDKVDLMVSGHSHGGQVNIPYLKDKILPALGSKYTYGEYKNNNSLLYVNPGLGTTKINARLFAKPEITFFNIN